MTQFRSRLRRWLWDKDVHPHPSGRFRRAKEELSFPPKADLKDETLLELRVFPSFPRAEKVIDHLRDFHSRSCEADGGVISHADPLSGEKAGKYSAASLTRSFLASMIDRSLIPFARRFSSQIRDTLVRNLLSRRRTVGQRRPKIVSAP